MFSPTSPALSVPSVPNFVVAEFENATHYFIFIIYYGTKH